MFTVVFSLKKYSDLTDMILNEFGFTIKSQKKRTRENDKFSYAISYWLEEYRCNIKYFLLTFYLKYNLYTFSTIVFFVAASPEIFR